MKSEYNILLIEDNPGDVRLTREALQESSRILSLAVCSDGEEALKAFHAIMNGQVKRPDLVILDLNLPKHNGWEILDFVKNESSLSSIPIVVFTSSDADRDISGCYAKHANCFVKKPLDFDQYAQTIKGIEHFWFGVVELGNK